jgi:hypothetical protein
MAWQLSGEYLENCNCEILCPCITSSLQGPADNERCYVPPSSMAASREIRSPRVAVRDSGSVRWR